MADKLFSNRGSMHRRYLPDRLDPDRDTPLLNTILRELYDRVDQISGTDSPRHGVVSETHLDTSADDLPVEEGSGIRFLEGKWRTAPPAEAAAEVFDTIVPNDQYPTVGAAINGLWALGLRKLRIGVAASTGIEDDVDISGDFGDSVSVVGIISGIGWLQGHGNSSVQPITVGGTGAGAAVATWLFGGNMAASFDNLNFGFYVSSALVSVRISGSRTVGYRNCSNVRPYLSQSSVYMDNCTVVLNDALVTLHSWVARNTHIRTSGGSAGDVKTLQYANASLFGCHISGFRRLAFHSTSGANSRGLVFADCSWNIGETESSTMREVVFTRGGTAPVVQFLNNYPTRTIVKLRFVDTGPWFVGCARMRRSSAPTNPTNPRFVCEYETVMPVVLIGSTFHDLIATGTSRPPLLTAIGCGLGAASNRTVTLRATRGVVYGNYFGPVEGDVTVDFTSGVKPGVLADHNWFDQGEDIP